MNNKNPINKSSIEFIIFYFIVSSTAGILFSLNSKNTSFFKQLIKINYLEILINFVLIFLLSIVLCLAFSTPYFMIRKTIAPSTLNEIDKQGMAKISSVVSILFAMMKTLTPQQFELILDIIAFIPLITFSTKLFIEITKSKLNKPN